MYICLCRVFADQFFNNTLMLGNTSNSVLSDRMYDLILELNIIQPTILLSVLPQLEFKLKVYLLLYFVFGISNVHLLYNTVLIVIFAGSMNIVIKFSVMQYIAC